MRTVILEATDSMTLSTMALAQSGSGSSGDAPQNKGSTGWTGAHPETGGSTLDKTNPGHSTSGTTGQGGPAYDQDAAKTQPPVATGEDLKGPAKQFPPSQTPE